MVRFKPTTLGELLHIWGISEQRLAQHGELMLAALKPHLSKLPGPEEVDVAPESQLGDGRPHPHWLAEAKRTALPDGPWEKRRTYCYSEYGCKACENHGPDGPWAVQTQQLLNRLREGCGSYARCHELGWRWFASPNHGQNSHYHKWWPPLALCEKFQLTCMPMGTRAVIALLDRENIFTISR